MFSTQPFELFTLEKAMSIRQKLLSGKNMPSCCAVCSAQLDYSSNEVFQNDPQLSFFY